MQIVRGKAIVVFKNDNHFLFTICEDAILNCKYYIPVGGGIEFGELSIEAAKREVLEEIGQEIGDIRLLDIRENIFSLNGTKEHEIVFTYFADFKDKKIDLPNLSGGMNDDGKQIELTWASIQEIGNAQVKVYPLNL
jgi:ADP-ribose pyrophosphatase YjhB (NUDIX family)